MKKKLGLLATLAMCVTVGGVYAAWNYAGESADPGWGEKNLSITQATFNGKSGSFSVTAPSTLKIDDIGGYTPGWSTECAGALELKFTPTAGALTTTIEYTITILNNEYDDPDFGKQPIINLVGNSAQGYDVVDGKIVGTFEYTAGDESASKVWTIEQVKQMLVVNDAYTVDTHEEYQIYAPIVQGVQVRIDIKEL